MKENAPAENDKPVSPPTTSWEDILKELQQKQAESTAKQQPSKPVSQRKEVKQTDIRTFPSSQSNQPVKAKTTQRKTEYKSVLTDEDKIERGTLRLENEGVYKVESIQEMEAREKEEMEANVYQFNAREALIGSVIMERKF